MLSWFCSPNDLPCICHGESLCHIRELIATPFPVARNCLMSDDTDVSFICRERQNREASQRSGDRDLTRAPDGAVPPPYSFLESELSDTGGETTETSMSEPEPTDLEDEPISPPPPYAP